MPLPGTWPGHTFLQSWWGSRSCPCPAKGPLSPCPCSTGTLCKSSWTAEHADTRRVSRCHFWQDRKLRAFLWDCHPARQDVQTGVPAQQSSAWECSILLLWALPTAPVSANLRESPHHPQLSPRWLSPCCPVLSECQVTKLKQAENKGLAPSTRPRGIQAFGSDLAQGKIQFVFSQEQYIQNLISETSESTSEPALPVCQQTGSAV